MKSRRIKTDERRFERLADFFSIFGDPARLKILTALMEGEHCVNDLSGTVDMTQSAVSHQLRVLKQAHVVRTRRDGKNILYSLDDDHIETILSFGIEHILENRDQL
ncbi:MAG TPA: metalloregulator ArsR/SmtB family transcription factor [Spirochaetota bacterium]|nr:metalloregulator ArsR/SmtB family transcription factor [Spirochaetota bacterium]